MALDPNINTLEKAKFRELGGSEVAVAVVVEGGASDSVIALMLSAEDRQDVYSWADAGTVSERVTTIVTTAPSVTSQVLTTTFTYTAAGPWYVVASKNRALA